MNPEKQEINEAARLLGRKGGLKGGRARAESLTAKRRSAIARAAGAKGNARFEGPKGDAARRMVMRRRTWTAYCAGREVRLALGALVATEARATRFNPYKRVAFQVPLFDAWLHGFWNAGAALVPFTRWRWPLAKTKGKGAR